MVYTGIDIVEIERIQKAIERWGDRFTRRIYTPAEIVLCRGRAESLAARWAAKEAVTKALATGWRGINYTEIEIQRQMSGAPTVYLHGKAAALVATWNNFSWQLSLSHDRDYAIAVAILIYE